MFRKVLAFLLMVGLLGGIGCGGGLTPVEGVVTLDGKEVEGASVMFVPDNPKGQAASGSTDASGKFTLRTGNKNGAMPGTYKVIVTKTAAVQGVDPSKMKPGTPEYQKEMAKRMGAGGPMGKPAGPKNELPVKYASAEKTDLKITVPPPEKPVKLQLSSK